MEINQVVLEKIISKIKGKMWDEEVLLAKKIKGHDWSNGYSSACHDFRTCIIDEVVSDVIKQEGVKE